MRLTNLGAIYLKDGSTSTPYLLAAWRLRVQARRRNPLINSVDALLIEERERDAEAKIDTGLKIQFPDIFGESK